MKKNNIIADLIVWLDENLENTLNVKVIAKKAGYSRWHIQRMFRQHTGFSLMSYVNLMRLCRAADLLEFTDMPIIDISFKYNFDTQQSFTRAFRGRFNTTPAKYRKTIKEKSNTSNYHIPDHNTINHTLRHYVSQSEFILEILSKEEDEM